MRNNDTVKLTVDANIHFLDHWGIFITLANCERDVGEWYKAQLKNVGDEKPLPPF